MHSLPQKLMAEAVGTALLLSTVVGSGIMGDALSNGNTALALLANALATGAMLIVLITMFAPISGAHFNPIVTLVFTIKRALTPKQALLYVIAQCIGGIIGVWAAHLMFGQELLQLSQKSRSGMGLFIGEFIASFGLIFIILATIKAKESAVPLAVGLYIMAGYWFTSSSAFANPAVTLVRAFTDSFAGITLRDVPMFLAAQFIAAPLALFYANWQIEEK